ncbi:MAG: family 43 glycosylhydrolase [Prevotellaceae bacterium]|nr:family 43 glycosylhydrolase [Prevotellaceae bacterium]
MKNYMCVLLLTALSAACNNGNRTTERSSAQTTQTICNPVNMSYRYQWKQPAYREGADPSAVLFKDEYYAFVSHSGGYFHSRDLVKWDLIVPNSVFPVETFAPAAVVIDDEIYLVASQVRQVVKTGDPKSGIWEVVNPDFKIIISDPALLLDDDGRLYYYAGCSSSLPIRGYELDPKTFEPLSEEVPLLSANRERFGWEEKTDYNTPNAKIPPHIEGAWVDKYNGRYYLQYANPGTELKSYNDGVYVADKPLGPYVPAPHNPVSYKPEGFVCGAGHGCTFKDRYGNYWHLVTSAISIRHPFERRLSIFPLFFDGDGEMYAYTGFGDYPAIVPDRKVNSPDELFPGWMLLSYGKPVEVSSTLPEYHTIFDRYGDIEHLVRNNDARNINDEEIRTWWSAATGGSHEQFAMDLGEQSEVCAVQINFADEGSSITGRCDSARYRYTIEHSADGTNWSMFADMSESEDDLPHNYFQAERPVKARFFRVKNVYTPSGNFSVSDFRVFGKSDRKKPAAVNSLSASRDADRRAAHLSWPPVEGATGYNIRYGSRPDKLYLNYMLYGKNRLSIHSLDAEQEYFFAIDAFNEGGITKGTATANVR